MERPHDVAGVILAAGQSRRFGSPKQLALLDGRTLLEHVVDAARAAGLEPIVAVVPARLELPATLHGAGDVTWVANPTPERGISLSLRLGLAALPPTAGAAIVLLGDQPRIPLGHLHALVAARGERAIVATRDGDHLTPPVLVERSRFVLVEGLEGDVGLREILAARRDEVRAIDAPEPIASVERPQDLDRLAAGRIGHMFDSGGGRRAAR